MSEISKEQELLNEIDKLQKQLEIANNRVKKAKYGLVWMEVPEAFEADSENQLPVLNEVKTNAINTKDGQPTHILIEGDNYHALTCLNYTHKERIDVIYIDPPYNRGADDFIYKDKRVVDKFPDGSPVPKNHPLRHSYWLSFMSKRLELAKNLLSKEGVIFISIDNNELAQLKLLCDSIFGEDNYVEIFNWEKTQSPSNLSQKSKERIEYILCYEKSKNGNRFTGLSRVNPNDNPLLKSNNSFKTLVFPKDKIECTLKSDTKFKAGTYGTKVNKVYLKNDVEFKDGKFSEDLVLEGKFIWTQDNLNKELKKKTKIIFKGKSFAPRYDKADYKPEVPPNLIDERWGIGTNDNSKQELNELDLRGFDYPKPISLIRYLIGFIDKPNAIVLDFFAGTGTTGHSILEMNSDSESNRQFIVCTNNEKEICTKVTYPRLKKAINGYKGVVSGTEYKPLGGSLKHYKTSFVGQNNILSASDEDKSTLAHKAGYLLAIAENTLDEVEATSYYQFFENSEKTTAIYFKEELDEMEAFLEMVEALSKPVSLYLFSWGNQSDYEGMFDHVPDITIKTIPQPILEIYKNIYNIVAI